ncbi:hypothetical protein [Bifidobacterium myosotis]|nr:hypothetical protein [Bifidobacterium myosotis]
MLGMTAFIHNPGAFAWAVIAATMIYAMRARGWAKAPAALAALVGGMAVDYALLGLTWPHWLQTPVGILAAVLSYGFMRGVVEASRGEGERAARAGGRTVVDTTLAPAPDAGPDPAGADAVARMFALDRDDAGWRGWRVADRDAGGPDDPLMAVARMADPTPLERAGRIRGRAGAGLETSGFDADRIAAGGAGERNLGLMVMGANPPVVSWWSLYGMDADGGRSDADIDAVFVGVRPDGRHIAWFVDAKAYKGGADTAYANADDRHLLRVSRRRHALVTGADGRPWIALSPNMAIQRERWEPVLERLGVESRWLVCMTPAGRTGTPDVTAAVWPGGIRCTAAGPLLDDIRAAGLADPAGIRPDVIRLFDARLKRGRD